MRELIQKLISKNIFKQGTMIDANITKSHFGSPLILQKTLRVKK